MGEFKLLGLRMLAVLGNYYAAEKIVDVSFMRSLHERLGAAWLIVGIPRRGLLIAIDARMEARLVKGFLRLCEAQFLKGEHEPLSLTPLLVHEGKISGFAWEKNIRSALATAEPRRGFFSRVLGRKKG